MSSSSKSIARSWSRDRNSAAASSKANSAFAAYNRNGKKHQQQQAQTSERAYKQASHSQNGVIFAAEGAPHQEEGAVSSSLIDESVSNESSSLSTLSDSSSLEHGDDSRLVVAQFEQLAQRALTVAIDSSVTSSITSSLLPWSLPFHSLIHFISSKPQQIQSQLVQQIHSHFVTLAATSLAQQVSHSRPVELLSSTTRSLLATQRRVTARASHVQKQLAKRVSQVRSDVTRRASIIASALHDQSVGRLKRSRPYQLTKAVASSILDDLRVAKQLHDDALTNESIHSSSFITTVSSASSLAPLAPSSNFLQRAQWRARRLVYSFGKMSGQSRRLLFSRSLRHWPIDALTLFFQLTLLFLPEKHSEYDAVRDSLSECLRWYEVNTQAALPAPDGQNSNSVLAQNVNQLLEELSLASSTSPPAMLLTPSSMDALKQPIPISASSTPASIQQGPGSTPPTNGSGGSSKRIGHSSSMQLPSSASRIHPSNLSISSTASSNLSLSLSSVLSPSQLHQHSHQYRQTRSVESTASWASSSGTSHSHMIYARALDLLDREGVNVDDVEIGSDEWNESDERSIDIEKWEARLMTQTSAAVAKGLRSASFGNSTAEAERELQQQLDNLKSGFADLPSPVSQTPPSSGSNNSTPSSTGALRPPRFHSHAHSTARVVPEVSTIEEVTEDPSTLLVPLSELTQQLMRMDREHSDETPKNTQLSGLTEVEAVVESSEERTDEPGKPFSAQSTPEGKQRHRSNLKGDDTDVRTSCSPSHQGGALPSLFLPIRLHFPSNDNSLDNQFCERFLINLQAHLQRMVRSHVIRLFIDNDQYVRWNQVLRDLPAETPPSYLSTAVRRALFSSSLISTPLSSQEVDLKNSKTPTRRSHPRRASPILSPFFDFNSWSSDSPAREDSHVDASVESSRPASSSSAVGTTLDALAHLPTFHLLFHRMMGDKVPIDSLTQLVREVDEEERVRNTCSSDEVAKARDNADTTHQQFDSRNFLVVFHSQVQLRMPADVSPSSLLTSSASTSPSTSTLLHKLQPYTCRHPLMQNMVSSKQVLVLEQNDDIRSTDTEADEDQDDDVQEFALSLLLRLEQSLESTLQ